MDEVEVDGLRIAYRRSGHGPPVVLLHGGFSDSRAWRSQLGGLSDEFTVIAWDAPGCGGSSDPPDTFGRIEYGDCLAGFLEELGVHRPHVLGLSFGSVLALELYRQQPDLPASLVLASAYAGWAGSLPPEEVRERIRRIQQELEKPPAEWVADYLPTFFTQTVPQEVVDEAMAMMLDTRPAGMRAALRAFAEADLREVLPTISVPTLLLYGEADQRAPLHVAEGLRARIPGSQLLVLPGVGHDSNMEAPAAFNAAVRRFLREEATTR